MSYNRLRWDSPAGIQTQATNTRAVDNFGDDFVEIDALNAKLASTLTPTLLNEFRFQWGRDNEFQFSQPPIAGEPTNAVGGRSPQTILVGTTTFSFGMPEFLERASFPDERRWQFADTVTMTAGNHTLKFGGDINFVKDIINNLRFSGGEFNYTGATTGLPDFIVDYVNFQTNGAIRALSQHGERSSAFVSAVTQSPDFRLAGKCYAGNFNQGFGVLGLTMKTTDLNYFLQDDWRVTPRFTLNLGLRYEYQLNPDPVNVNPRCRKRTTKSTIETTLVHDRFCLRPERRRQDQCSRRLGTLLRSRDQLDRLQHARKHGRRTDRGQRQFTTSATNLPAACAGISADNCALLPIYPNLLPASNPPVGAVQYFDDDFQLPQIHQWDFIFEREIARNTVVSASYLGSFGNSLPNFVDTNLPRPRRTVALNIVGGPFTGQTYLTPIFVGHDPTLFRADHGNSQ